MSIVRALDAPVCLVQTPSAFHPSDENTGNMARFLTTVDAQERYEQVYCMFNNDAKFANAQALAERI